MRRVAQRHWCAARAACVDAFMAHYRGPKGTTHYFYSLDAPLDCALALSESLPAKAYAVSADVGPDLLAPIRRPSHLVVYVDDVDAVAPLRWTKAKGLYDANIILHVPVDRSMLRNEFAARLRTQTIRLVHPTQMLWDLRQLGDGDRAEAIEAMKKWILAPRGTDSASEHAPSQKISASSL